MGKKDKPEFTAVDAQNYRAAGQHIVKARPELLDGQLGQALQDAGFGMHPVVIEQIVKRKIPEVTAHLLTKEGRGDLYALNNAKHSERRSLWELERIAGRVMRGGSFARPIPNRSEVDEYLQQRRADIKAGLRRR